MISTGELISKFQYALDNKFGYIYGCKHKMWTEALQKAATREMTVKYGKQWVGHWVTDCSGLFWWAFNELGGYMYHGSNTMFKSYCDRKGELKNGKRADGQPLKPGTAIFTGTATDHGHVGLYVGNGYIIEAKGTQYGVIKSPITQNRWTWWGELKGVDYGEEPSPEPVNKPTLRKGDKGEWVTYAQTRLIQKGYSCGSKGADGIFGNETEKAVRSIQRDNYIVVDGIIGKNTWEILDKPETTLYTVTIPNLQHYHAEALVKSYPGAYMTEEGGE